ncbi:hypothetical protein ACFQVA_20600 [Actinomadura keratinilytica]
MCPPQRSPPLKPPPTLLPRRPCRRGPCRRGLRRHPGPRHRPHPRTHPPPRPEERLEKAVRVAEQALIEFEIAVETFRVEVENFSRLHHQKLGPMYTRLDELDAQIAEAKAARTGDAEDLRLAREARARVMPMPGVEELFHGWIDSEGLSPRAPPCSTISRCVRRSGCAPAPTPAGSIGTWSARPTPTWRRARPSGRVGTPSSPGSTTRTHSVTRRRCGR